MGKVSIWAQWLMIMAGVLLSSLFALILACLIGWLLFDRLWPRQEVGPGSPVRRAEHAQLGLAARPFRFRHRPPAEFHLLAGGAVRDLAIPDAPPSVPW